MSKILKAEKALKEYLKKMSLPRKIGWIFILLFFVVQPLYGAYLDGYFYFSSNRPHHRLIRAVNQAALQGTSDISKEVKTVIAVNDSFQDIAQILQKSGFEIVQEYNTSVDQNIAVFEATRVIRRMPFPFMGYQCAIAISVQHGKVKKIKANITRPVVHMTLPRVY